MQKINSPTIIVFDEFEKTYDWDKQSKVLTLFDGVFPTKKLFMLTTNDSYRVNGFLKNRPGRMFYSLEYDVIEADVLNQYVDDKLKDKTQKESIVKYSQVFTFLNFDMLSAIIEEMNRYDETLGEVLEMLNVKPEMRPHEKYSICLGIEGTPVAEVDTTTDFDPNKWANWFELQDAIEISQGINLVNRNDEPITTSPDPSRRPIGANTTSPKVTAKAVEAANEESSDDFRIGPDNLVEFNGDEGKFTYKRSYKNHNIIVEVTRQSTPSGTRSVFNFSML